MIYLVLMVVSLCCLRVRVLRRCGVGWLLFCFVLFCLVWYGFVVCMCLYMSADGVNVLFSARAAGSLLDCLPFREGVDWLCLEWQRKMKRKG
ncbi:hypothetical protein GGR50DRAFT_667710 [Xylaria sp. CBS 124048]|nr:hypothetical protein GGR50DRAFT_667710 [Xylaria sp. CBS 124048]